MRDDPIWQIADVIVAEHTDEISALCWSRRILAEYPGCLAAVGFDAGGSWIFVRVRGDMCPG